MATVTRMCRIHRAARTCGLILEPWDRVISHHQRIRLTYDALDRDSNRLARGLQKLGVKKGERVAVSLGNNAEFATVCCKRGGEA
jgi:non-ribosomal peptide synthetase component E (peptide arylation enzyme)